ncbi:hypothetical protein SAMN03097699_0795 [Flavobacteriaceae bacterium MAR_2010_188]|nr:hypothetical protein SAMN03097699_0795 [Flavobacteriaceae bacterium MAR_2010_188]
MSQDIKPSVSPKKKDSFKDKKVPWWFGLQINDAINPIKIRRIQIATIGFLFLVVGFIGYYAYDMLLREPTGAEFVDKIVDVAGGMDAWDNLKHGKFTRVHNLYAEDGDVLRITEEVFFFKKTDEGLKLQIKSTRDDGSVVWVGKDAEGYWASRDGKLVDPKDAAKAEGMMCDSKFCEPLCASSMAFYRFSMPFKLKDPGINASLASTDLSVMELNLMDSAGQEPTMLDITFDEEVGRDRWRFYVDPSDQLIHKMEYYNKSDIGETRPEEIYWTEHKTESGITFSHRWTRYWPNGKVMDEYIYQDVDFDSEIADSFFERPKEGELAMNN